MKGRERIYLDRFWNEFSADPTKFPEASRAHYARLYARPGAMLAGFEQLKAFDQDAVDNKAPCPGEADDAGAGGGRREIISRLEQIEVSRGEKLAVGHSGRYAWAVRNPVS